MAEDSNEKLHIRLHVYDMMIPVNVRVEEEPLYRDAAKLITGTINTYASVYKDSRDKAKLLYMALIEIAVRYQMETKRNDIQPYEDIMGRLTAEIESALKEG